MITSTQINSSINAKTQKEMPFGLGNTLFMIAGVIGIATKNGYDYGFPDWINQEYFVNPLPKLNGMSFKPFRMHPNYNGCDVGFISFKVPDNVVVQGYLGSYEYFRHCEILLRHYFEMKPLCMPLKDSILIHYRDYDKNPGFLALDHSYYKRALEHFPDREIIVVTDNIEAAKKVIQLECRYINQSPILDFYLLAHTDYLIMSNSTFSWWAAWMSEARTVAPREWFAGEWKNCPFNKDWHLKDWIIL
jgi:hypothetical protein